MSNLEVGDDWLFAVGVKVFEQEGKVI